MAIADDLTSIILIVASVLAIALLTTVYLLNDSRTEARQQEERYMQDYANSAVDAYLRLDESKTSTSFNVLWGNYIYTSKQVVASPSGPMDLSVASREVLDRMLGAQNYYINVTPMISDAHISFVVDGASDMRSERVTLANNIDAIRRNVSAVLNNTDANVNMTVYVISSRDQAAACAEFTGRSVRCLRIGPEHIYSTRNVTISAPQFGPNSQGASKPQIIYQADWVAGTQYANERFRNTTLQSTQDRTLHIIIPMANKLSTSSISDQCLNLPTTGDYPVSDFNTCSLCNDDCPVARSGRFIPNVTRAVNDSGAVVIPLFSSRCSFPYDVRYNNIGATAETRKWVSLPIGSSLCAQTATCRGCTEGADLNSYCFHTNCHTAARTQMGVLAQGTGGEVISIDDINDLPGRIVASINTSVSRRSLELGTYNESRKRYVIERNILLPDMTKTTLEVWVYEDRR